MADKYPQGKYDEFQARGSEYSSDGTPASRAPQFTKKEERKIIHKIDLRLVMLVGFMYCVSLMDRTNVGNAKAAGMGTDPKSPKTKAMQGLNLIGYRYNIMSLVFFPPYIVFQIPSTVIVRKLGPRMHLGTITLLWGAVMIGMAFVTDWKAMSGMRVLLGALEAGFFPSCVYLLSTWYTRYEMGRRYSLFYITGSVASAFAGLLAYALMGLAGKWDLSGWRWIFLVEGIVTCGVAFLGYALLVGFPDDWSPKWHFLSRAEVDWVIEKVNEDRSDAIPEPFTLGKYLRPALDWKIWAFAMIFFNTTTISYALAYFLPDILHDSLHYSRRMTQVMVAPPYVFSGVIMWITGWYGDRYKVRGPIIVFNMLLCVIGLPMLGWVKSGATRYVGVFILTAGANANVPTTMTYQANNIRGQWKRAFCSASLVGFGGIGGIAGSMIFRSQDAKGGYKPGLYACITCATLNIFLVGILSMKFVRDNKKQKEGKMMIEGDSSFRYTV